MTRDMFARINIRVKVTICVIFVTLCILYWYEKRLVVKGDTVSMALLLAGAIRSAELGGAEVTAVHNRLKLNVENKGKTKEGIDDPVTAADYRSHCAMYYSLSRAFPNINIISEEKSKDCDKVVVPDITDIFNEIQDSKGSKEVVSTNDVTIWIDPLDATKEFTENLLQYVTTMVCIAVKGKPVIGVVYKPFESDPKAKLFWGWVEHNVSLNLNNLSKIEKGAKPVLIVSRSHAGKISDISKSAFGPDIDIVSAAGAGYKFLEVASGNATAYVHVTAIKKWDICAGTAILSALGGKITSLYDSAPISFGFSEPKVLDTGLLATMRDHYWYIDKLTNV